MYGRVHVCSRPCYYVWLHKAHTCTPVRRTLRFYTYIVLLFNMSWKTDFERQLQCCLWFKRNLNDMLDKTSFPMKLRFICLDKWDQNSWVRSNENARICWESSSFIESWNLCVMPKRRVNWTEVFSLNRQIL